jgi:hypothetical protein
MPGLRCTPVFDRESNSGGAIRTAREVDGRHTERRKTFIDAGGCIPDDNGRKLTSVRKISSSLPVA